jgi:hypothetical protein
MAAFLVYKWYTDFLAAGLYVVPTIGWDPSDRSSIFNSRNHLCL